jgi:peptide/nickel transport system permease protein
MASSTREFATRRLGWPSGRWLRRVGRAPLSLGAAVTLVLAAVGASWLAPYSPYQEHVMLPAVLQPPSPRHWLGTDQLGRDVLSRVLFGARVSLGLGIFAVTMASTVGSTLGILGGYRGGWWDHVLMRVVDALQAFPTLILAIGITAVIGTGVVGVTVAIGVLTIPIFARLARSRVLQVRMLDYVEAAHALGASDVRTMARYVLPNVAGPLIVQASVSLSFAILIEAGLSFLGLGVQPPTPSWGNMVNEGKEFLEQAPWLVFAPGGVIFIAVMTFNFLGDAMRDALDPAGRR